MIDIKEHGGLFGGTLNKNKILKTTISLTQPTNPVVNEIWLKTDTVNNVVFYNTLPTNINENDIMIPKSSAELVKKKDIRMGSIQLILDEFNKTIPTDKIMAFDSTYYSIYLRVGQVLKKVGNQFNVIEAYWYNGTDWIRFSVDFQYILAQRVSSNTYYLLDWINGTMHKTETITGATSNMFQKIDYDLRKIMFADITNKKFYIYDYEMNLIETLSFTSLSGAFLLAFDYEKRLLWTGAGTYVYLYDFNGNLLASNSTLGYFSLTSLLYDKETNTIFVSGNGNGSAGQTQALNASTLVLKAILAGSGGYNMNIGYCNNKKSIFITVWSSSSSTATVRIYNKTTYEQEQSFSIICNGSYNPWGAYIDDLTNTLVYSSGSNGVITYKYDILTATLLWKSSGFGNSTFTAERNGDLAGKHTVLDPNGNYYVFTSDTTNYLNLVNVVDKNGVLTGTTVESLFGVPGYSLTNTNLLSY